MLVFTRKVGESVIITTSDGIIKVTLMANRNQAKIGFDAPKHIVIHREEVQKIVDEKNKDV